MATEKHLHKTNQRINMERPNLIIKTKRRVVFEGARSEISRILNYLNLPMTLRSLVKEKFEMFWFSFSPGTKYRNHEVLVPLAIYSALKSQKISVKEDKLLNIAKVSKREFKTLKQILL